MKLWQKETSVNKRIENFTVGKDRELDSYLAEFDVLGSMAHTKMLESIQLIPSDELPLLHKELLFIYRQIKSGNFIIEDGVEDVHSQVELMLTRKLGDIGKKIHSGRSRNDQVLVDLKLFIRQRIHDIVLATEQLFDKFILLSEQHKDALIPGYTHLQVAMPSSFGLWFGAYAESLVDDLTLLQAAYRVSNKNPLGSGAGYGSSFPLNRTMTTELLGFETLNQNVVYAQMGRGKTELAVSNALASIAATLSRMSMDVCLYISQNFAFLSFPDELTTGSSIMPHKKNPDVFELIRAKCNKLKALPTEINSILSNLPSGYHRDMQIIKESFIPAFDTLNDCIEIAGYMFEHVIINNNIVAEEKYKYIFSVERVNELVLQGIPFRDAYKVVGEEIANGTFNPSYKLNHTHEGSLGNLRNAEIRKEMQAVLDSFNFSYKDQKIQALLEG
ncbi:MAG TPA: argininosuccinate lyase [Cytophagales bacterium]|nr:argininosuccinate lyase [Cytophagales bacterium]